MKPVVDLLQVVTAVQMYKTEILVTLVTVNPDFMTTDQPLVKDVTTLVLLVLEMLIPVHPVLLLPTETLTVLVKTDSMTIIPNV